MSTPTLSAPELMSGFRGLATYPTEEGRGEFIRMDFNEGPPPPMELLARCLAQSALAATLYPEYGPLKQAAARAFNLTPDRVLPVNGADEGIALLLRGLTGPGCGVVLPVPTFPMYRIYAEMGATPILGVPLDEAYQVDAGALLRALPQAGLLALCSPNNPTGRTVPKDILRRLVEGAEGKPVILDETYAPFSGEDAAPWLAEFPNLVLLRTLSKAQGLPGLRCGFVLGDPRLIQRMDVLRSPFNVNALAASLGARLLGEDDPTARLGQAVQARRDLQARMEALGIATVPSDTHFFLADLGARSGAAVAFLRACRILIKDMGKTLPGMVRISVADPSQGQALWDMFRPWWVGSGAEPS